MREAKAPIKKSVKAFSNEAVYKTLIDNMNEAVWVGDDQERTLYANLKFSEITGYKLEEMLGKESYFFWTQESADRVRKENKTKRKKGESSSYEGELLTKDGEIIPVLCSGTPLDTGGSIGIMTDLRELKKKEERERVMNKAIQYSRDAIITFDMEGKIKSWNKGAKIIFGYKEEEIINAHLDKIFLKKHTKDIFENSEVVYNFEITGKHKNKRKIDIAATLTPIFSSDNKNIIFYLLIARDISNQTKFEEDLALKYKKMKEAYNKFGVIRRQMDYIFDLVDVCEETNDKKTIADFIVSSIIMLTRVDACMLRLHNKENDTLDLISYIGFASDWEGKSNIKLKNSLAEEAFEKGSPLKIIDITKESKYQSTYLANKNNLCSLLLIPLSYKGRLIGSISLYTRPDKKLEIFENEFIEKYAKLIEIIVEKMM